MQQQAEAMRRIPIQPVFDGRVSWGPKSEIPSILDMDHRLYVSSASAGIFLALRSIGVGEKDEVLLPAYICESVLESVIASGASPTFYGINPDTTINVKDLEARVSDKTRVLVVTHYFGRWQDMQGIRRLASTKGLKIIEDCAHALFGDSGGFPAGHFSDYVVGSLPKFLPVYEGGVLGSRRDSLGDIQLSKRSISYEIKCVFDEMEMLAAHGDRSLLTTLISAVKWLKRLLSRRDFHLDDEGFTVLGKGRGRGTHFIYLREDSLFRPASLYAIFVCRFSCTNRYILRRQNNYRYLEERLDNIRGVKPLFDSPDGGFVPYVFPLLVEKSSWIERMREKGLPFWMWENIHNEICSISIAYARSLIQLPCHQSLRQEDLDKMIACIRECCR